MPQVKMKKDHTMVVDKSTKRTFPKDWTGTVTAKELKSITDAKAGEEVGGDKKAAKKVADAKTAEDAKKAADAKAAEEAKKAAEAKAAEEAAQ